MRKSFILLAFLIRILIQVNLFILRKFKGVHIFNKTHFIDFSNFENREKTNNAVLENLVERIFELCINGKIKYYVLLDVQFKKDKTFEDENIISASSGILKHFGSKLKRVNK